MNPADVLWLVYSPLFPPLLFTFQVSFRLSTAILPSLTDVAAFFARNSAPCTMKNVANVNIWKVEVFAQYFINRPMYSLGYRFYRNARYFFFAISSNNYADFCYYDITKTLVIFSFLRNTSSVKPISLLSWHSWSKRICRHRWLTT